MKANLKFLFLCVLVILIALFSIQTTVAQTKHALIFAISNYPEEGGWARISSSRDVFYMKTTLQKQGFQESNIQIITEEQVTTQGITKALTELINKAKHDDIAVLHFSTHGEQVEDDNGDETDGLDETIVTYHAIKPEFSRNFNKDQAEYFRDDQFGILIDRLRDKIGRNGEVVVFMDLCHSGSGTRTFSSVRGSEPALVSKGYDPQRYVGKGEYGVFRENIIAGGAQEEWGTYVVFSAARAGEASFEVSDDTNQAIGVLTYAISKAFEKLDAGITYRTLFARVQSIVHAKRPGQFPVLEGNGIDRTLFGGKFVLQKAYVDIEKIAGTELTLKSGKLAGLDSGAKIGVYPAGTLDPQKATALASGTVTKAGFYRAITKLDKDPGIRQAESVWAFVSETVYVMDPISVRFISFKDMVPINDALKELPLITFEGEPELIVVKGRSEDSIKFTSNDRLFKTIKHSETYIQELKEELRRYAQYRFLHGLEFADPSINVDIRLIPVINKKADTATAFSKIKQGTYTFQEGDTIALWVRNHGNHSVYFNVLDLQSDGIINPVVPNRRLKIYTQDLKIAAGQSRLFQTPLLVISPPYGIEIFKIFASRIEIDMESIVEVRRGVAKSGVAFLEKLVAKSYEIGVRKKEAERISTSDGSVYSLLFEIRPRK